MVARAVAIIIQMLVLGTLVAESVQASTHPQDITLPPIGKRRYVLPENSKFGPVVIQDEQRPGDSTSRYLRDPNLPALERTTIHKPELVKKQKPPLPKYKAAELTFPPSRIVGRLTIPRVEFDQRTLPVAITERPWRIDLTRKTANAARDF